MLSHFGKKNFKKIASEELRGLNFHCYAGLVDFIPDTAVFQEQHLKRKIFIINYYIILMGRCNIDSLFVLIICCTGKREVK
ncbi:MAG: hypothetical protein K9M56_04085 [Victivallales bacterium]|nr:hypothetical protein [Victivallales bacterium]